MFEQVVTLLLSGKVICGITHEDEFLWLSIADGMNANLIDEYLNRINRKVRVTSEKDGYFCVYNDHTTQSATQDIKKQFAEIMNDLAPLVYWLSLTQSITGSDRPLRSGDVVSESVLLSAIESVPDHESRLTRITDQGAFKSVSSEPKKRLSFLLTKLVDKDYLVKFGSSGSQFKATGKWTLLYDIMNFIAAHEGINQQNDNAESSNAQKELI